MEVEETDLTTTTTTTTTGGAGAEGDLGRSMQLSRSVPRVDTEAELYANMPSQVLKKGVGFASPSVQAASDSTEGVGVGKLVPISGGPSADDQLDAVLNPTVKFRAAKAPALDGQSPGEGTLSQADDRAFPRPHDTSVRRSERSVKPVQKFGSLRDEDAYFCGRPGLARSEPKASNEVSKAPSSGDKARRDKALKGKGGRDKKLLSSFLEASGFDPSAVNMHANSGRSMMEHKHQLGVCDLACLGLLLSDTKFRSMEGVVSLCGHLKEWFELHASDHTFFHLSPSLGEVLPHGPHDHGKVSDDLMADGRFFTSSCCQDQEGALGGPLLSLSVGGKRKNVAGTRVAEKDRLLQSTALQTWKRWKKSKAPLDVGTSGSAQSRGAQSSEVPQIRGRGNKSESQGEEDCRESRDSGAGPGNPPALVSEENS
ncbi:hypothetical protein HOP50_02g17750 [Chloropicon primus]|nr:hypothetical protein HOP50_02g17750 [Chloropicon primus]